MKVLLTLVIKILASVITMEILRRMEIKKMSVLMKRGKRRQRLGQKPNLERRRTKRGENMLRRSPRK